ncbi:MAG TPA: hypothetical protein VIE43_23560 [Thermoanaerobaculia bacterium]|nr:hypothetical protein [Thermoanaerobaculia bacterium]
MAFSVPIIAIVSKAATRFIALRAEQRALGTSNHELELKVERLERANAESARRLENLEAIVVSQTWNVLGNPEVSEPVQQHRLAAANRQDLRAPATEEMNRQRAADLASRLGG